MTLAEFLILAKDITLIMVVASLAIAFIRLARGPTLADRVVALDMMTVTLIAVCDQHRCHCAIGRCVGTGPGRVPRDGRTCPLCRTTRRQSQGDQR